ncbi:MAG TPA: efflux RND transporter periplasmic adaptor subunit, partial [Candidatus Bathyarchaeia archaeon]|nr:efflux RND transporter periplasmic adaptor subunit [Candidatus Bathyarchaeia archaeon]
MKKKYFLFIGIAVVVVILVMVNLKARGEHALPVQSEEVTKRDLTMVISASGSIRAKRKVDISASSIGKVTKVAVKEGETVKQGQFLLQIDPVELESTVARLEAMLEAAKANEKQAVAQAEQAKNDYERAKTLLEGGYRTTQEVDAAKTNQDVAVAHLEAVRQEIAQEKANLESARHSLKEVTIVAPMSGVVTRRNVEEGEIAIMGTLNNIGTALLTIADLSTIETELQVDETEVTHMKLGDKAKVKLDALPDTSFKGEVTEIGNSPIVSGASAAQQGVDF